MTSRRPFRRIALAVTLPILLTLGACGATPDEDQFVPEQLERRDTIFGPGGLTLGGSGRTGPDATAVGGMGVNGYLWRGSLDTFSFMPLVSADAFGGVIITDWYMPPETPGERFKVNIYILGRELRADGIRVAVFRQVRDGAGAWSDAEVDPDMPGELENAILTRARELRMADRRSR